jgi:hypothetical protein
MEQAFEYRVERFVAEQFRELDQSRAQYVERLDLEPLLRTRNPYFARVNQRGLASEVVESVLDGGTASIEESLFDGFLKALAVFVSEEKCNGRKSGITGIDIELERGDVRYLIAVKSGKAWGNATQHKKLRDNFQTAVKVLRQNKAVGEIQPTLGICYGRFKTVNNGAFLHIGGQSFWELISGEPDLYMDIIEPIGHRAKEFNDAFHTKRANAMNRMEREFLERFCLADGSIDWARIVTLVSKNA